MAIPIGNPYNLGMPIRHEWQFAGREAELEKIDDCLDQAIEGGRVNILVVGESGIGKTSLLNVAECRARARGILTVKVAIDSQMGQDEIAFFREIYHKIISEGTKIGMFRWFEEPVRFVMNQLDYASMGDESILALPLRFPRMFAECISTNKVLPVMTSMLKSDFEFIVAEARRANVRAIALIFDDADNITKAISEKLKGLLTDVEGYFMCIAGSDKLVGVWNEVLSPMPRIFLRINLLSFPDQTATRTCVRRPLEKAKYRDVEIDPGLYPELYALTGGNPYEIQVLCHFMYQRLTKGETDRMSLHPSVLETMVEQLEFERPHVTEERAFQKAVRRLTKDDLELAVNHLEFEGLSSEEHALCKLAFAKPTQEALDQMLQVVQADREKLQELNVIELTEDTLSFRTGVFGRIYLKYFYEATTKRPPRGPRLIGTMPGSVERFLLVKFIAEFLNALLQSGNAEDGMWIPYPRRKREPLKATIDDFCRSVWEHDITTLAQSDLYFPLVVTEASEDHAAEDCLVMSAQLSCRARASIGVLFIRGISEDEEDSENAKNRLINLLNNKLESASEYGISLQKMESERLPRSVVTSSRELGDLSDNFMRATRQAGQALIDKDPATALVFATEAYELTKKATGNLAAEAAGNLGFVEMCDSDFENALRHTSESLSIVEGSVRLVNLAYILASMAETKEGRLEAEEAVKKAIRLISRDPTQTAWLLMIYLPEDEILTTDEPNQCLIEDPVVDSVARCTLASLLALRGEMDQAKRTCDLAELRSSDRAFPLRTKARILLLCGEMETALDTLKRATEVEPSDNWAKTEYDKLRAFLGQKDKM